MNPKTECEIETDLDKVKSLLYPDDTIRIRHKSARRMLLENTSRICGGTVRYYQVKHIGLDVYEVRLLPVGKESTVLVEIWKTVENNC